MNLDISDILDDWPYQPGQINVRTIVNQDGKLLLQMRLDMGLLQMQISGRPDGKKPFGQENLLKHYLHLKQKFIEHNGSDDGFSINETACKDLRAEAVMYYHRYLAEFVLEQFEEVIRDTKHNLAIIEMCSKFSQCEEDRICGLQHKPYIIMMNIRARLRRALKRNRNQQALAVLNRGIELIENIYREFDQEDLIELSNEIQILRGLEKDIKKSMPVSPQQRIKEKLRQAIDHEDYELAALLRDELNALKKQKTL